MVASGVRGHPLFYAPRRRHAGRGVPPSRCAAQDGSGSEDAGDVHAQRAAEMEAKRARYEEEKKRKAEQVRYARWKEGWGVENQTPIEEAAAKVRDKFRGFRGESEGEADDSGDGTDNDTGDVDVRTSVRVSFAQAVLGGEVSVGYTRSVVDDRGRRPSKVAARVEEARSVKVKVPPGVESGRTLRVASQGSERTVVKVSMLSGATSEVGGEFGDLFVTLFVDPSPLGIVRVGNDLYQDVAVGAAEARDGCRVSVETVDGTRGKLGIPAGARDGQKIKLKGKGVPVLQKDLYARKFNRPTDHGDHYYVVRITGP